MAKFTFEVSIESPGEKDAIEKLKAATTLMQKLQVHELSRLADIVKNDPVKTNLAKRALGL
ncbi:MAG: hypothetical protein MUF42_12180 [Cytophagaceae bacterium]|jgi:hypothetical protein|nr:hypothetical protein [Cytophagaceae bacterium]